MIVMALWVLSVGWAAEPTKPAPPTEEPASSDVSKPARKRVKGKRAGEKETTEGTQAPNRFEADTVIKSQYRLHGESLEVDPD
jgi:hypothetical protein